MTAPQTKIPTETSKRLLFAIVVTSEEIHVLSCVKTVVRPSRLAVTSATLVVGKRTHPLSAFKTCSDVDRRKQETNKRNSKRQDYSTRKHEKNIIFRSARQGNRHAEYLAKEINHLFSPYKLFYQFPQIWKAYVG